MLIDGGGFGTITGNSFQIKQSPVAPSSASGLTAAQIEQMFSYLPEPSMVSQSGSAFTAASQILADLADSLVKHVQVLHQNWTGTASDTAVGNFQQLHETAIGLAQASAKTGAVLSWMGELLPFYKSYKAPALSLFGHIEAAFGDNPSDKAAQAVLERFNNRLVQANENLPNEVTKTLPTSVWRDTAVPMTGGAGGPAGAGSAASGVTSAGGTGPGTGTRVSGPGGGTPAGNLPKPGTITVGHLPTGSKPGTPPPDQLASAPPGAPGASVGVGGTPPGSAPPPGAVAPGGPGGGGFPVVPGGAVPGDAPPGGLPGDPGALGDGAAPGDPGAIAGEGGLGEGGVVGVAPGDSAVIGSDGMIGAGPGAGGPGGTGFDGSPRPGEVGLDEAFPDGGMVDGGVVGGFVDGDAAAGGLGAGDSGATGFVGADGAAVDAGADGQAGMGLPMGGGAGGGRERERKRQAWMPEDADIWEGRSDESPSQIGSLSGPSRREGAGDV